MRSIAVAFEPGRHDDRLVQRLAHLELGLAACREPEPDRLAGDVHRLARARGRARRRPGSHTDERSARSRRGCRRSRRRRTGRTARAAWRRSAGTRAASRTRRDRRPRSAGASGARTSWRARRRTSRSRGRRRSRRSRPCARARSRRSRCSRDSAQRSSSTSSTSSSVDGRELVGVRVQHVEPVRVPQLQQELPHRLADRLQREAVAVPRLLGGEQVPAQRVGAEPVDDVPRLAPCCPATWTSCGRPRRGSARGRRRCDTATGRTAASRRRSASRTSRASGPAPRTRSPPGTAPRTARVPACGAWYWANGIEPESNQTSITSATRLHRLAALGARERDLVDERAMGIGELDPRQVAQLGEASRSPVTCPLAQRHTGSGVPQ